MILLIITGHPLKYTQEDLDRDGAEFSGRNRLKGIWRGMNFHLLLGKNHYDCREIYGMVADEILILGKCDPKCIEIALTRIKRHGTNNSNTISW